MKSGIPVYTAEETQSALEIITGERTIAIPPMKSVQIGSFKVTPFNVPHDVDIECYGYLIQHEDMGKLLFVTDLEYCPYNFQKQKVNHILVEANYDLQYVDCDNPNYEHVLKGHMSIQTAHDFIKVNDSSQLRNVVLLHLSEKNSDSDDFLERTKEVTGKNVFIAKKGLKVDLNLIPF